MVKQRRDAHTDENVLWWLDRLKEAASQTRGLLTRFFDQLEENAEKLKKSLAAERSTRSWKQAMFSRAKYYDIIKTRKRAIENVNRDAFEFLKRFVTEHDEIVAQAMSEPIQRKRSATLQSASALFAQLAHFVGQRPDQAIAASKELPGLYLTYRPSLSRPGWLVVGLLSIQKHAGHRLSTFEETMLLRAPDIEPEIQVFKGNIVYSPRGLYLMMADCNNSQFPRISILRSGYHPRGGRVQSLDGIYCGHNVRADFSPIVASHIWIKREHDDPGARGLFKGRIGYRRSDAANEHERVSDALWAQVFKSKVHHGIFDF